MIFSICTTPSVGVGRKCVTATSRLGQFWGEQLNNNYQNTCIKLTDGDFTFEKKKDLFMCQALYIIRKLFLIT